MNFTLKELGIALESLPNEYWRWVPHTGNRYLVSNMGRLLTTNYKGRYAMGQSRIMKPAHDANGYMRTMLIMKNKSRTVKVHRIVAFVWIPNPEGKWYVNHINCVRDDNRVENLEWVSPAENNHYTLIQGRQRGFVKGMKQKNPAIGSKNPNAIVNEQIVREIRAKFKPRIYTKKMLAEEYGINYYTVVSIIFGREWKHVK